MLDIVTAEPGVRWCNSGSALLPGIFGFRMEKGLISGIMQRANLEALMVASISNGGDVGQIFRVLGHNRINIEFINQIAYTNGDASVILCVDSKDLSSALALLEEKKLHIKARDIVFLAKAGILSVFPHREHALVVGATIKALSAGAIPLIAMGSSISAVSCVINEEKVPDAIRLLSNEFGLS